MSEAPVKVQIQGRDYLIRRDGDEAWLRRVADCVDTAMTEVRERTAAVDSLDVSVMTSLNLAREVLESRKHPGTAGVGGEEVPDETRIKALIEMVESVMESDSTQAENDTPLLTLPAGRELEFPEEPGDLSRLDTEDPEAVSTGKKGGRDRPG
jgi:cell division protein ZapA (FtsZ GTPase activity inhibitor)